MTAKPPTSAGTATDQQGIAPSLIHRPGSFVELLDLDQLFPAGRPLEVELGSGDGSFLVNYAQGNPGKDFLGVERLLGRLRKIDRKAIRLGLQNIRLIRIEASYCLQYLLPANRIQNLHIYFPDPWPKRRHQKNRLVDQAFAEIARAVLIEGGTVFLRTDDVDYFAQMQRVFTQNGAFDSVETPEPLSRVTTDFERGFTSRGVPVFSAAFRRRS